MRDEFFHGDHKMTDDGFENIRKNILSKQAKNDHTIPVITVGPAPRCYKCRERMILKRLFRNEVHLREYWKCYTPGCKHKLQIDDQGNPIYKNVNEPKTEPKPIQERFIV